jgi:hypothetical protein
LRIKSGTVYPAARLADYWVEQTSVGVFIPVGMIFFAIPSHRLFRTVSGRIDLEEIKAVGLADRARHAFFHQAFEKETKDLALNSVSSGSSNSE